MDQVEWIEVEPYSIKGIVMEGLSTVYDERLKEISILKLHPEYLPFVGEDYDAHRILHVGESHYINQQSDSEKADDYGISYFEKWWSDSCEELNERSCGWFHTRGVINNYMRNDSGSYTIFNNFLKSYSRAVLHEELQITAEAKKRYRELSFMNFFQMPSLYEGKGFWDSLYFSAKKEVGKKEAYKRACDTWYRTEEESVKTLDAVIDILEPRAIVITGLSAGRSYQHGNGKYVNDSRMIITSHPAYPFTWNKPLKSLDGKSGIDVCEEGFAKIFGK